MTHTPTLGLPLIMPGQAQKHITHNEALETLDTLVQLSVESADFSAPPTLFAEGERYIVGPEAAEAWAGKEAQIATAQSGGWIFLPPETGWRAWITDRAELFVFDGAAWNPVSTPDSFDTLGIGTSADATNRLAVASEASLFTHAGAGHQIKLNKAAPGDTASVLFQTAYGGRAEVGTTGDDRLRVKVSANGQDWTDALTIEPESGTVSFPQRTSEDPAHTVGGVWRTRRDPSVGWMTHSGAGYASYYALTHTAFVALQVGVTDDYSRMSLTCFTPQTDGRVRVALYKAAPDNLLGALVMDFGEADCSTAGVKTLTVPATHLEAGLYYAVITPSRPDIKFRGGFTSRDTGAGFLGSLIYPVGIGRIMSHQFNDSWPADMTGYTIGNGPNQLSLMGSFFCPTLLLS